MSARPCLQRAQGAGGVDGNGAKPLGRRVQGSCGVAGSKAVPVQNRVLLESRSRLHSSRRLQEQASREVKGSSMRCMLATTVQAPNPPVTTPGPSRTPHRLGMINTTSFLIGQSIICRFARVQRCCNPCAVLNTTSEGGGGPRPCVASRQSDRSVLAACVEIELE